jgi:glycosyltransferase involved in cell wall biosynthesis
VPPGDPAALARELIRVLSDDHLADSLRTAGLHQARRFSLDGLAERYVEIYEDLVLTARQPRVPDRQ